MRSPDPVNGRAVAKPFVLTAGIVATLMLQALLLPLGYGDFDVTEQWSRVSDKSWKMLAIYVVLLGAMGAWTFAGRKNLGELELGKRLIYASTIALTLPLWIFMNGFLGDNITDMVALWLVPFAAMIAGAALTKDWRDMMRTIVIGFGVPVASMFLLASFVDFGN